jgi:hypothetical protein
MVKMRIKMRYFVLLACVILAVSCARKKDAENGKLIFQDAGSGVSGTSSSQPGNDNKATAGVTQGTFTPDATQVDKKALYSKGCKAAGESERDPKITLELPKSLTDSYSTSLSGHTVKMTIKEELVSKDDKGYKSTQTYQEISGVEGITAGTKVEQVCTRITQNDGSEAIPCKSNNEKISPETINNGANSCVVIGTTGQTKSTNSSGTFTTHGGNKVKATYFQMEVKGATLRCDGIPEEFKGDFIRMTILTNEAPRFGIKNCGGDNIVIYEKVANEQGKTMRESTYEVLGFEK